MNFLIDKNNLVVNKGLDFWKEIDLTRDLIEEMKETNDEKIFWNNAKTAMEKTIKLYRYAQMGKAPFTEGEEFDNQFQSNYYILALRDDIYYSIEEALFGFKTLCKEQDKFGFIAKIYPNKDMFPHINIFSVNILEFRRCSILYLTDETPQTESDLRFSEDHEALKYRFFNPLEPYGIEEYNFKEQVVKWANEKNENGMTNWDYAKEVYRKLNNLKGKFRSKNDKFAKKYSDKLNFNWIYPDTYPHKIKFIPKKFRKTRINPRNFLLKKNILSDKVTKFHSNDVILPKNFNVIEEMYNILKKIGRINTHHEGLFKEIFKNNTLKKIIDKLLIIHKYYKVDGLAIDNILYEIISCLQHAYFDSAQNYGELVFHTFEKYNFQGMIYLIDGDDPHFHIFTIDDDFHELGKLFITNEVPQTESDLRFSEDSDKDIPPEILKEIIRFAKDHWLCFKSGWAEINYGDACRSWEENHDNCDYPWFKSKDEEFSIK